MRVIKRYANGLRLEHEGCEAFIECPGVMDGNFSEDDCRRMFRQMDRVAMGRLKADLMRAEIAYVQRQLELAAEKRWREIKPLEYWREAHPQERGRPTTGEVTRLFMARFGEDDRLMEYMATDADPDEDARQMAMTPDEFWSYRRPNCTPIRREQVTRFHKQRLSQ